MRLAAGIHRRRLPGDDGVADLAGQRPVDLPQGMRNLVGPESNVHSKAFAWVSRSADIKWFDRMMGGELDPKRVLVLLVAAERAGQLQCESHPPVRLEDCRDDSAAVQHVHCETVEIGLGELAVHE